MRSLVRSSARRGLAPALKKEYTLRSLFFGLIRYVQEALANHTSALGSLADDLFLLSAYYTICLVTFNVCIHALHKHFGSLRSLHTHATSGQRRERADSSGSSRRIMPYKNPDVFHLLDLPPELVAHFLTFLPTPDRLRARVCRSLYLLESTGQYHAGWLDIAREGRVGIISCDVLRLVIPEPDADRSGTIAALAKLAGNVEFTGTVALWLESDDDRWIIPYVQEIRTAEIFFSHADLDTEGMVDDANFDGWAAGRNELMIHGPVDFSGEKLYEVYNVMESGRSNMWQLQLITGPTAASCRRLMQLLGLSYHDGQFHSTRKDVEIFALRSAVNVEDNGEQACMGIRAAPSAFYLILLGSRMKISVRKWIFDPPTNDDDARWNDLAVERFDEEGNCTEYDIPTFDLTFRGIRGNEEEYGSVLMTYE